MVPPTGTQTEQGNLSQKRCDLKNVGFGGVPYIYIQMYSLFQDCLSSPVSLPHLVDPTNGSSPIEAMSPQQPGFGILGEIMRYLTNKYGV